MPVVADSHMHTKFSADGRDDLSQMCRAAVAKGLSYICVTDHIDSNPTDEGYHYLNYDRYSESIERAREEFGDRIHILKGIEFSEPHVYRKEFEEILNKDFDLIMVGIHYIKMDIALHWLGKGARNIGDFTDQNTYHQYHKELLQVVRLRGFDVLAHFDNPKRYMIRPSQEAD